MVVVVLVLADGSADEDTKYTISVQRHVASPSDNLASGTEAGAVSGSRVTHSRKGEVEEG